MSIDLQQAIKNSLQTEKNAMNFYQVAAAYLQDAAAKKVFEILAREEREHAGHFYKLYTGTDLPSLEAFLDAPIDSDSSWTAALEKTLSADANEKAALELALDKEKKLEEALRDTASKIADPAIKEIYELNAKETANHYAVIEAEYARIMGMIAESDQDTFVRE